MINIKANNKDSPIDASKSKWPLKPIREKIFNKHTREIGYQKPKAI